MYGLIIHKMGDIPHVFEISAVSLTNNALRLFRQFFFTRAKRSAANSLSRASGINGDLVPKAVVAAARTGADEVLVRLVREIDALSYHEVDRRPGVEVGK